MRAPKGARVVDLAGKTMLPGLTDSHAHLADIGERELGFDLTGIESVEAMKQRLAERAAADRVAVGRRRELDRIEVEAGRVPVAAGSRRRRSRPPRGPAARGRARRRRELEGARDRRHHAGNARPRGRPDPAGSCDRRADGHPGRQRDGPRVEARPARNGRGAGAPSRGGRRGLCPARLDRDAVRGDQLACHRPALPALRGGQGEAACLCRDRRAGRRRREAARRRSRLQVLRPAADRPDDQALHGRRARLARRGAR